MADTLEAQVTVDYVNQPRPGKKKGSIKTKELGYIGVWPDKLDQFTQGKTYLISYEDDGQWKNFKEILSQAPTGAADKVGTNLETVLPDTLLSNCLASLIAAGVIKSADLDTWKEYGMAIQEAYMAYHGGPSEDAVKAAGGELEDEIPW